MKLSWNASSFVYALLLAASSIRTETGWPTQPTFLIWPFTEQTCWSLVQCFLANKACWKPQSFPSYNKSLVVLGRRGRNLYTFEVDRCILARRGVGRSGSMSSPAKKCRAQSPKSLLPLLTSLPTGTPPPPASPSSAALSSWASCQECDLLKPGWWGLQLQEGRYFYPDPASCLTAGGFHVLVFGFVISGTDSAPWPHQNRAVS